MTTRNPKYTASEHFYELKVGRDFILTKELPLKWHCAAFRKNGEVDVRFNLVESAPGINKHSVKTIVEVTPQYFDPDSGPFDGLNKEVLLSHNQETTVNVNIGSSWEFLDKLNVKFTVFVYDTSLPTFAGYEFTEDNEANYQVLVVEGKKFHVNSEVLSEYSPFFENLFQADAIYEKEIELKELDANEFEDLLQVIFPTNVIVNADNAEFLWKLAVRFEIKRVIKMCENFVCNAVVKLSGTMSMAKRMKMAELYHSDKLMSVLREDIKKLNVNE